MSDNKDFTPDARKYLLTGETFTYTLGPMFLADGSDGAYLFDPEGETHQ